jgi:hypothetical protein
MVSWRVLVVRLALWIEMKAFTVDHNSLRPKTSRSQLRGLSRRLRWNWMNRPTVGRFVPVDQRRGHDPWISTVRLQALSAPEQIPISANFCRPREEERKSMGFPGFPKRALGKSEVVLARTAVPDPGEVRSAGPQSPPGPGSWPTGHERGWGRPGGGRPR